jgi:ATP-dependent protease ClpP protease subunit
MRQPNNLRALRAAWRAASEDVTPRVTPCFEVRNATDETAKLYVYDVIGGWDLDSSEFVKAVHGITAKSIDMHVNSPGGFVYDAVSMYEAVKQHPANVTTHIDGLAASAASFLALAGDSVEIARGGRMMIHDAQGVGIGSPADMREYADLLDEVSNDIAGYYAEHTGGKPAKWRAAMTATTWYSASEAVSAGLADRISGDSKKSEPEDLRSQLIRARARVALGGVQ